MNTSITGSEKSNVSDLLGKPKEVLVLPTHSLTLTPESSANISSEGASRQFSEEPVPLPMNDEEMSVLVLPPMEMSNTNAFLSPPFFEMGGLDGESDDEQAAPAPVQDELGRAYRKSGRRDSLFCSAKPQAVKPGSDDDFLRFYSIDNKTVYA